MCLYSLTRFYLNDITIIITEYMVKQHLLLLLLCVTVFAKISIHSNPHNFLPSNQQQYVQYLSLMLGKHQETTPVSQNIIQLFKQHRPSLINAAKKIILILAPSQTDVQNTHTIEQLHGKQMSNLVGIHHQNFAIKLLSNGNQQEIQSEIENLANPDHLIQVIRGTKTQIQLLCAQLEQKTMKNSPRRLQQTHAIKQAQQDKTYLIKFFFSILFVFVIIGSVGFIVDSDSKKDTLLYAKFIADVSNVR